MFLVLKPTGLSIQPERAELITPEEIERGLKAGVLKQLEKNIFRFIGKADETDETQKTEQENPSEKKPKRGRGRPRKFALEG